MRLLPVKGDGPMLLLGHARGVLWDVLIAVGVGAFASGLAVSVAWVAFWAALH